MSILVEIVCCSVDDAIAAERGGADRIELCAALGQGGLTPSPGLFRSVKAHCSLPVMAMVRPRSGGFCYTEYEFDSMLRDLDWLLEEGADGIVTGCLLESGHLDVARNKQLKGTAGNTPVVAHRCFDVVQDQNGAMEALIDVGFCRILTSGRRNTALDGANQIRKNIEDADGRIEILPGGGIRPENVREIVRLTGATQVHLAPLKKQDDRSTQGNPDIFFAGSLDMKEGAFDVTDEVQVRRTVEVLRDELA
ncbi:MAG: copper homeostasis protein CutC [Fimbriimonadaceae bacterium]|nr:copper homeostasis protein CutC [Fimbriimonadaceae bacterium]